MKEKKGRGTGMGTLMPTMPTSISFWNFRAAAPDCVKMAVPLPCCSSFTILMASSSVSACASPTRTVQMRTALLSLQASLQPDHMAKCCLTWTNIQCSIWWQRCAVPAYQMVQARNGTVQRILTCADQWERVSRQQLKQ